MTVPASADGPTLARAVSEAVAGRTVSIGRGLVRERYSAERMAGEWAEMLAGCVVR